MPMFSTSILHAGKPWLIASSLKASMFPSKRFALESTHISYIPWLLPLLLLLFSLVAMITISDYSYYILVAVPPSHKFMGEPRCYYQPRQIRKHESGVASNGITSIPSFVKNHQIRSVYPFLKPRSSWKEQYSYKMWQFILHYDLNLKMSLLRGTVKPTFFFTAQNLINTLNYTPGLALQYFTLRCHASPMRRHLVLAVEMATHRT
jgi:hypothetical protein